MPKEDEENNEDANAEPENNPNPVDTSEVSESRIQKLRNFLSRNITLTTKEWIYSLLNQPTSPPFKFNADFNDELGRVVRLIAAVLTISGILVGGVVFLTGNAVEIRVFQYAITIFIIAVLVALVYLPFFYICGVRIYPQNKEEENQTPKPLTIGQVFFTFLYILVPWMPILVFIKATVVTAESIFLIDFFLLAPFICVIYILINLAKSLKLITNCPSYRIWLALLSPFLLILLYFMFL